eukprot:9613-Heterococcus_DN1.PRE.1
MKHDHTVHQQHYHTRSLHHNAQYILERSRLRAVCVQAAAVCALDCSYIYSYMVHPDTSVPLLGIYTDAISAYCLIVSLTVAL